MTKKKMKAEPIIRLQVNDNPKRLGSEAYKRFSYYEDGITVNEYLRRGGTQADIRWDLERHFIRLEKFDYVREAENNEG